MKKIFFGVLLLIVAVSCEHMAIVRGSGRVAESTLDISLDYTELSVQEGIKVILVPSETGEVIITADEKIINHISVEESRGRVKISYYPGISFHYKGVETVVTMPISKAQLTLLKASSSAEIVSNQIIEGGVLTVDASSSAYISLDINARRLSFDLSSSATFKGDVEVESDVDVDMSSSSDFRGAVIAETLDIEISSSAEFLTSGIVNRCDVEASSSGSFKGFDLECKMAYAEVSSSGLAEMTVLDDFEVKVSSGGSVRYKGSPRIRQNVSSGGTLRSVE